MSVHNYKKLIISILFINFLGFLSGFVTNYISADSWYESLVQPWYTPPGYIFVIVWSILYTIIGVSFYFIWNRPDFTINSDAFGLFILQLFLNLSWSIVFFGLNSIELGLVVVFFLNFAIFGNILEFYKIDKTAARLLIPYLMWVIVATILNLGFWFLN